MYAEGPPTLEAMRLGLKGFLAPRKQTDKDLLENTIKHLLESKPLTSEAYCKFSKDADMITFWRDHGVETGGKVTVGIAVGHVFK